jgi:endonuclease/exonuclease/phosphatase family metal-dependent hydrolase
MVHARPVRGWLLRSVAIACAAATVLAPVVPASADGARTTATTVRLRVAEFNIEYGGTVIDFDQVVAAIRASGADVVGIEEAEGHIPRLARALGWPFYDVRTQVVSKYPLIDPSGGDGHYLYVEVQPGKVAAIENVHLPSWPYGPNKALVGATRRKLLALERRYRLPAIRPFLRAAQPLRDARVPLFLVGDFNAPSFRDWTRRSVGTRPQIRFPVRWPVSVAVERAGFQDSYRTLYPNEVRYPGLTWWATRPRVTDGWNPARTAPQDRIDVLYTSDVRVRSEWTVGEPGGPGVRVPVWPWPSDHRMVVGTFSVEPVSPPAFVSVGQRLVTQGNAVRVRFHGATPGDHVAVIPHGSTLADAIADVPTGAVGDGTASIDTGAWAAGRYVAELADASDARIAKIPFWVKEPGAGPTVTTGKHRYGVGEPIDVTWANTKGERWDWVGIYKRGADPLVAWYLDWAYTRARPGGTLTLDQDSEGPWPLKAGRYTVYVLRDDGYRAVARADFRVG